jgi:hypothetical protein
MDEYENMIWFKWTSSYKVTNSYELHGSKWTSNYKLTNPSGVFDNSITSNGVQITNQPIQMKFVTI